MDGIGVGSLHVRFFEFNYNYRYTELLTEVIANFTGEVQAFQQAIQEINTNK